QVGHKRAVTGGGQEVGYTFDLIIEAPPFLNHYNRWCTVSGIRFDIKSRAFASIRSLERNHHADYFYRATCDSASGIVVTGKRARYKAARVFAAWIFSKESFARDKPNHTIELLHAAKNLGKDAIICCFLSRQFSPTDCQEVIFGRFRLSFLKRTRQ